MRKERKRAAHLGSISMDGQVYRVTFRAGWLYFRPYRCRRQCKVRAMPMIDLFNLADVQKTFAFLHR